MRFEHDERTSRINKGSGFDNYRNQAFYLFLGRTFSILAPGHLVTCLVSEHNGRLYTHDGGVAAEVD